MEKLFYKIKQCKSEEEVRKLINMALEEANANSKSGLILGYSREEDMKYYKGFINKDSRIRFTKENIETYGMKTTDYFYGFATMVWKNESINNPYTFMRALLSYIIYYFGKSKFEVDTREDFLLNKAGFFDGLEDRQYFENVKKLAIGDLRGKGMAMCTERAAIAQNILSLFNFETYYAIGKVRQGDKEEYHAFNIVKSNDGYTLVDFSMPVLVKTKNGKIKSHPFLGTITEDQIKEFLDNGLVLDFDEYEIDEVTNELKPIEGKRKYIVTSKDLKIGSGEMTM